MADNTRVQCKATCRELVEIHVTILIDFRLIVCSYVFFIYVTHFLLCESLILSTCFFCIASFRFQVYHIGRHIPSWFRSVVPKTALEVHEESWNAYPCTKTKFSVPFVEKFTLEVDTVFQADRGDQVK